MFPRVTGRGPIRGSSASLLLLVLAVLAGCSGQPARPRASTLDERHSQRRAAVHRRRRRQLGVAVAPSSARPRGRAAGPRSSAAPRRADARRRSASARGPAAGHHLPVPPAGRPQAALRPAARRRTSAATSTPSTRRAPRTARATAASPPSPCATTSRRAGESLAAFIASNPAGTKGDRRVLCMRPGTQEIGQLNGLKAWSTLTPRGEADGTKQPVVLNGNIALQSPGATVEDVRVVGCWRQGGCSDEPRQGDRRARERRATQPPRHHPEGRPQPRRDPVRADRLVEPGRPRDARVLEDPLLRVGVVGQPRARASTARTRSGR